MIKIIYKGENNAPEIEVETNDGEVRVYREGIYMLGFDQEYMTDDEVFTEALERLADAMIEREQA